MNTSQLKITINAEGESAADILKLFGKNMVCTTATTCQPIVTVGSNTVGSTTPHSVEPSWVEELREAIRRVEETVEKYNVCRLAAQRQVISQYEDLREAVEAIQVREWPSTKAPATSAASVASSEAKEAEEAVAEVNAEIAAAEAAAIDASEEANQLADGEEEEQLADSAAEEEEEVVEEAEEEEVVEEAEEEEVVEEEAEEEEVVEEEAEEAEEEGLEEFEYKGKTYYKDSENTVYTLNEDDEPEPRGIWNEAKQVIQFYKTVTAAK